MFRKNNSKNLFDRYGDDFIKDDIWERRNRMSKMLDARKTPKRFESSFHKPLESNLPKQRSYKLSNSIHFIYSNYGVILTGDQRDIALKELIKANPHLNIKMKLNGELSAKTRKGQKLDPEEEKIYLAIKDHTVITTIIATGNKLTQFGDPNVGNFSGNYTDKKGITHATQEINAEALSKWDKLSGNPGKTTNHEVSEAYYGAKIAQQEGILKVDHATMADANDPASVYYKAHNAEATKQPAGFERKMYDINNNRVENPADYSVPCNVTKIDYINTSSKNIGETFHTIENP
ncbi:hypothetical protein DBB36_22755 [Flavobacterium sp. WLB]|uniref:hypothetical protein n=1 Tax=unclassified Flavobacterium TaxID=196869 RepID=UPI0006AB8B11|nr:MULTISPECIES: hypothetical protein [unclassified Flavobacterium]KOP36114.1 hypothetical protein AKO67_22170 [Flavobacterium sp. VMW]OWU89328.1 hypothetical protein APR43_19235 [Flavobacterium sp. NLM]PUU67679.1 hypothetical protein DBB36_22755 [Flavobacterium sp. WLB]